MSAAKLARVPGFLSGNQLLTDSAKKRRQWIEHSRGVKKEKQKEDAAEAKQPHASSARELKGVLARDAYYRQNCHDYLETKKDRNKVFLDFDMDFAHKNTGKSKKELEAYMFPVAGSPQNFNPGATEVPNGKRKAGQRHPYLWEAHHLLPGSAFYYEDENGHCFESWQIRLILQSEYNINHGHNIIPLPDESDVVPIHRLLEHPSDHPVYTQEVMKDLRVISDELHKARDQGAKHSDLVEIVFRRLKKLEDKYWKFLVDLGKTVTEKVAAGERESRPWVKYGSRKKALKYKWGALY